MSIQPTYKALHCTPLTWLWIGRMSSSVWCLAPSNRWGCGLRPGLRPGLTPGLTPPLRLHAAAKGVATPPAHGGRAFSAENDGVGVEGATLLARELPAVLGGGTARGSLTTRVSPRVSIEELPLA